MSLSPEPWKALCAGLDATAMEARFGELCAAYNESHRHYHTGQHISECLAVFDEAGKPADHPLELELAIYLHDIVYRPRRNDNEAASARVAQTWLEEAGGAGATVERVVGLIEITRHDRAPQTNDEALLIDVDLNVLGASEDRYDEYETQVRREYRWAPGPIFRRRRAQLLEEFLEREFIYYTAYFRNRFEAPARANLRRAINTLRGTAE